METEVDRIHVTHLNIRPSISLLLAQLIMLSILTAAVITGGYLLILNSPVLLTESLKSMMGLFLLWIVFSFEIFFTIYAVMQWINEYYEITPHSIIHKKGLLFRKIEKYSLDQLAYLNVDQGLLGKLLNYGTLTFLSARREKLLELYAVHNPNKYLEVVESIKPNIGRVEDILRGSVEETEDTD